MTASLIPITKPMGIKACPYCAEEIQEEAVICKHCKSNLKASEAPKEAGVTVAKSDKAFGAATGFFGGLGCGIWLIIFGLLISLTGIGAIIGIPLALAGLLMPFIAPVMGLAQVSGRCPHCTKHLVASSIKGAVTCKYCKKRVVIDKGKFVRVD